MKDLQKESGSIWTQKVIQLHRGGNNIVRVHELAKEMDKTNKEVLDVLKEKNIEVKSHMSSLSDEEINTVKKSFDEKGGKDEKTSEDTQKKKHIVQVFRPQNSKNAGKMGSNRNGKAGGNRDGRQNQGNKQAFHKEKAERTERQERPAQDNSQVKKSLTNNAAPKRKERRDDNRRDDRRDNRRDDRRGDRRCLLYTSCMCGYYYGFSDYSDADFKTSGRGSAKNALIRGSLLQETEKSCKINQVSETIII